jgi:hypothetical protein
MIYRVQGKRCRKPDKSKKVGTNAITSAHIRSDPKPQQLQVLPSEFRENARPNRLPHPFHGVKEERQVMVG